MEHIIYDLNDVEKMSLQVLLCQTIETNMRKREKELWFTKYNAEDLFESIFLKLYKPSNFTEEKRLTKIEELENKLYFTINRLG